MVDDVIMTSYFVNIRKQRHQDKTDLFPLIESAAISWETVNNVKMLM